MQSYITTVKFTFKVGAMHTGFQDPVSSLQQTPHQPQHIKQTCTVYNAKSQQNRTPRIFVYGNMEDFMYLGPWRDFIKICSRSGSGQWFALDSSALETVNWLSRLILDFSFKISNLEVLLLTPFPHI